jgi:hypothetical protein
MPANIPERYKTKATEDEREAFAARRNAFFAQYNGLLISKALVALLSNSIDSGTSPCLGSFFIPHEQQERRDHFRYRACSLNDND